MVAAICGTVLTRPGRSLHDHVWGGG